MTKAGDLLFYLRRYEQALAMFEQASELQPDEASHHGWQGKILLQLRRNEDALAAYQQALAISPQIQYYDRIGKIFLQLTRYQEALDVYEQALQTTKSSSLYAGYAGKGQALLQLNRYDEALICYQTAIRLNGPETDPQCYHDLGTLLGQWAQHAYAMEHKKWMIRYPEIAQNPAYPQFARSFTPRASVHPALGSILLTYEHSSGPALSVVWSPDGKCIASAAYEVYVWQVR